MTDVLTQYGARAVVQVARPVPDHVTRLAYLEKLLEHERHVMFVRDGDGRFLLASSALAGLLGRTVENVVGRTTHELFDHELADEQNARDRLVWTTGRESTSTSTPIDRNGVQHEFVTYRFPISGPDGTTVAVGGYSIDLTQATAERRTGEESQARFRAVFEHAPIGQIFSGMDGVVSSVNVAMAGMLGYRPEEMIGRRAREYVVPEDHDDIQADVEAMRDGAPVTQTATRRFRHRDGHIVPAAVTSALLRDHAGEPQWWISMIRDITDEERARVALERAHDDAVRAADRLRVLHAISTAANEATGLDEIAPVALALVSAHIGSSDAVLARWRAGAETTPRVAHGPGWAGLRSVRAPGRSVQVVQNDGEVTVLVRLPGSRGDVPALAFRVAEAPDNEQLEMLGLVGGDVSRVIERETSAVLLRESEERFRSVFDSSPLPMGLTLGDTGTYSEVNQALCEMLGLARDELVGRSAHDVCHPDDIALADPAGAAALASPDGRHRIEMRLIHSSGEILFAVVTLTWMHGADGRRQLLAQMEDVTARRTAETMLRRQAEEDELTGLANRTRLSQALVEHGQRSATCLVLFIDVDAFKLINDTRGHEAGDEVLTTVARRLRDAIGPTDLLARFGGDEFVVVRSVVDEGTDAATEAVAAIRAALAPVIVTRSGAAAITASIGVAQGRIDPAAPQSLLERADSAMYQAKRLGKDRHAFYDDDLHRQAAERRRTEATLSNALDEGRFTVQYQPIVDLASRSIVGVEALVRLVDDDGALVPPGEFIAVAEQSGLIVPMGTWVLQESCRWLADARHRTGRPLTVSVNVAARQAARPDFADTVLDAVRSAGLPETAVTLELTESALLEADKATLRQLEMLRGRGVAIALDDFGTGYSSLTYLRRLPVSHLKVDRSFVSGMVGGSSDRAIVRAVTRLAEDLGISWIAEGVETDDQHTALAELGPGLAQGFLYGRPTDGAALTALLS